MTASSNTVRDSNYHGVCCCLLPGAHCWNYNDMWFKTWWAALRCIDVVTATVIHGMPWCSSRDTATLSINTSDNLWRSRCYKGKQLHFSERLFDSVRYTRSHTSEDKATSASLWQHQSWVKWCFQGGSYSVLFWMVNAEPIIVLFQLGYVHTSHNMNA